MTAGPGWERTHRTGRRQPEERGPCVLRPAAKVIAHKGSLIPCVVRSHLLTRLSCHKTLARKMRAAERSEPDRGRQRRRSGQGGKSRQRFRGNERRYVAKVQNDTSYHYDGGSGACQLLCYLTPARMRSNYDWHTPTPPSPPSSFSCNSVKSASRPVTHHLE